MKTWLTAVSALAALTATAHAQPGLDSILKKNAWFNDYNTARAETKRTGKPLMVVFRCVP